MDFVKDALAAAAALLIGALIIVGIFLLLAPTVILDGWVLSILWRWFVTPVFPALPVLSVAQATGLFVVVGMARLGIKAEDYTDSDGHGSPWMMVVMGLAGPLLLLLLGQLVLWVLF